MEDINDSLGDSWEKFPLLFYWCLCEHEGKGSEFDLRICTFAPFIAVIFVVCVELLAIADCIDFTVILVLLPLCLQECSVSANEGSVKDESEGWCKR